MSACIDCRKKPAVARKRCTACYATWRRMQPGRCRYCGGVISAERPAASGKTHDSCLKRRRELWGEYRMRIVNGYGGRCACCGLSDERFLTIDHVNNNGNQHRAELGGGNRRLLLLIIQQEFPPEFQLLCFNCNCAKSTNGGVCPHEEDRRALKARATYDAVMGNSS